MFLGLLQEKFKVTIGLQIKCQSDGSIFVRQEVYTNKMLKKFNMAEAKGVSMPASCEESNNHKNVSGKVPYHEAVGSLMYLATTTHPDIAFVINKAARIMDRPAEKDWNKIKCIFCYFRSSSNYGVRYTCGSGELKVFSGVDFVRHKVTRHFTMGFLAIFADGADGADGAVSWTSQLQKKQPFRQLKPRSLQ